MPLFLASLIGALVAACGTLVGRVLVSLGIGYVTFTGIDTSVAWIKTGVLSNLSGMPAVSLQVAGLMKVGPCISILLSSLVARMTLAGLTSGALTKMVQK